MSKTKSSLPLQLVAAALVSAVVSFGVASFGASGSSSNSDAAPPTASADLAQVLQKLNDLESRLQASERTAADSQAALTKIETELRLAVASNASGLNEQGKTVTRIEQFQTSTNESVRKVQASYQGLNGRIEGNYTKVRGLDRRVKKLEGK